MNMDLAECSYIFASVSFWYLLIAGVPFLVLLPGRAVSTWKLLLSPSSWIVCPSWQSPPTHTWFPLFQKLLNVSSGGFCVKSASRVATFVQGQFHPTQCSEIHVQKCDYSTQSIYFFRSTVFEKVYQDYRRLLLLTITFSAWRLQSDVMIVSFNGFESCGNWPLTSHYSTHTRQH